MSQQFERELTSHLDNGDDLSQDAKHLKKWFAKNPKGLLRRRAIKQLENQADAMGYRDYDSMTPIDWDKLLEMLGPFIKLLLSFLAL